MRKLVILISITLLIFTDVSTKNYDPPVRIAETNVSTNLSRDSGMMDVQAFDTSSFVSQWNTSHTSTGSSTTMQIGLPLVSSGSYDFIVDWGDGKNNTITVYN